jgi:2-polyprenyl-6-methoxyphenol hydroxylase-like FAD-dependent oxidoreductase
VSVIRPVLIVGAGPTGLAAALELSRLGVGVRIIDKLPAPSAVSRALAVHPWTLELLEQRGLSPELLPASSRVTHAAVYGKNGLLGKAGLSRGEGHRGHLLLACQTELERMLREQLARQEVMVEYATEMIALTQTEPGTQSGLGSPGVTAVLSHHDGCLEECAASYLISADGMHSKTGRLLELPAPDKPDGRSYVLAELRLDGDLRGDVISICLGRDGFAVLLPRDGGWFQFIATDPRIDPGDARGPGMTELRQLAARLLPASAGVRELRWSSRFRASRRVSPVLQHGRVFFGGDAAYTYCPAAGQGVNSGIQDMINLGWKLAMVLQGKAAPVLLSTYAGERLQAIHQVVRRAEVPARVLGSNSAIVHQLVMRVAPAFLDSRFVLDLCADLAGDVIPDYWASQLSAQPRGPGNLQPGDSVPDMPVLASDLGAPAGSRPREMRLHELISRSKLTLLLADAASSAALPGWPKQLRPWRELMRGHAVLPAGDPGEQVRFFRALGDGQSLMLVRPDSYVCFAGRRKALPHLLTWLNNWFPPVTTGNSPPADRIAPGK